MMNLCKHLHSATLGWGLAVVVTGFLSANAQQAPGQASSQTNPDLTRHEIATFDQFLDQHPDIDKQLTANPSLINNSGFLKDHPELSEFLASHKEVSEEIKENPNYFMQREQRFENAENRAHNPNPDLTRKEVATFDQFLDQHPDIDKQLTSNPSLINNPDFLKNHPELSEFLANHKEVSEEIKENPNYFMQREQRFENAENRAHNPNPDLTRKEVATFDQFLDQHPDIDKQLTSNPSLINNPDFLKNHPELSEFLANHKEVSEEIKENPNYFMQREQRFENAENRAHNSNPDLTRKEVAGFDQFLDKHPDLDKQLQANPGLVNDHNFLKHHKELRAFLKDHPDLRKDLQENASQVMHREQRFDVAENRSGFDSKNPDLTRKEVASFDDFLDHHKNIAKDLTKDPDLIKDPKFVKNHHDLQKFLEKNPRISEEFKENPRDFMQQEARLEKSEHDRHMDRARADKDKQKAEQSALEEREKLQTANPH